MQVIQARSAGFCYGVRRAVELTEQALAEGRRPAMLGPVIHNTAVIDGLCRRGARLIRDPREARPGEPVVIRAHGEGEETYRVLQSRGAEILDGTCPHVRRIQQIAREAAEEGRQMILIGNPDHPEIRGICGWGRDVLVFSTPESLAAYLSKHPETAEMPVTAAAQTTQIQEIWESSLKIIKKQCTNLKKFDTICSATHKRQSEAAEIAAQVDVMVVVGDRQSANSRHLFQLCREQCCRTLLVEGAAELTPDKLAGCRLAGLTAGASTPASII